jgi:hypothetical protein
VGGVEGVVALERQTVNLSQRDFRAVELADRDRLSRTIGEGSRRTSWS